MIVYHGSNSNFIKLKVSPRLTKSSSRYLSEGYGIYFSLKPDVAKSYGKYLYTLNINDKYLVDYRKESECRKLLIAYLNLVSKETNTDLSLYITINNMENITKSLSSGRIRLYSLDNEIKDLLECDYKFYENCSDVVRENIYRKLRVILKKKLKVYLFKSDIPDIGIIKDVSDTVVKIVSKEKIR